MTMTTHAPLIGEDDNEIQDVAEYLARCEHRDVPSMHVTNASQVGAYNSDLPFAATTVCTSRARILDALAWVEHQTGEYGVWIDNAGRSHVNAPAPVQAAPGLLETYRKTRAAARRSVFGHEGSAPRDLTRGFNIGYDIASDWPLLAADGNELTT